jgi:hemolysin activation/secretion protein
LTTTYLLSNQQQTNKSSLIHLMVASALVVIAQPAFAVDQDAGVLQRQLQDQIEKSRPEVQERKIEKQVEQVEADPNAQKIEISGYQFKGNTLFSDAQLQEIVAAWKNRALTIPQLQEVTVAIQEAYSKESKIAQANVPPQEMQDGILLIEIIEAKLGDVYVESANADKSLRFSMERAKNYLVTNNPHGEFIDTTKIYRSVTLLNELPGVSASSRYQSGSIPGESDIVLDVKDRPKFGANLALSNYGSSSTGEAQAIANLKFNSPFNIGDILRVDAIQSQGSSYIQGAYTLPIGFDGLSLGIQSSYLRYKTISEWKGSEGDASTFGINASYALSRLPASQSSVRIALETRSYKNEQSTSHQVLSEYDITAITAGLNGSFSDTSSSYVNWGLIATLGNVDIKDAAQSTQDSTTAKTEGSYQKISFNVSRSRDLNVWENTNWTVSAYGQLASKNLNSSEQFYLGGPYAVRAYPVSQGGGSQGAILSTEMQHFISENWVAGAFVDVGVVEQYKNLYANWAGQSHANNVYTLAATGLTLKYTYKNFSLSGTGAYHVGENPLYSITGKKMNVDNDDKDVQFWVRGSLDF